MSGAKKLELDPNFEGLDQKNTKDKRFKETVAAAMAFPLIFSPVTMSDDHKWYLSGEERLMHGLELDMDTLYEKCKKKVDKGNQPYKIVFDVILLDEAGSENLDGESPSAGKGLGKLAAFMGKRLHDAENNETIEFRMLLNPKAEKLANHELMDFGWTAN